MAISRFSIAIMLLFTFIPGFYQKSMAQARYDKPYSDSVANLAYNLFFCDDPELFRPKGPGPYAYPFNILFSVKSETEDFQRIIDDPKIDPRYKILAYRQAKSKGIRIYARDFQAVIIEVGQKDGVDALSLLKNGTARYINQSGQLRVLSATTDKKVNELIQELLASSQSAINWASPWEGPRWPHPLEGMSRITILASDRLYFSESPTEDFLNNRNAGPTLINAMSLMRAISEKPKGDSTGKKAQ